MFYIAKVLWRRWRKRIKTGRGEEKILKEEKNEKMKKKR